MFDYDYEHEHDLKCLMQLLSWKSLFVIVIIAALWLLETFFPQFPGRRQRVRHDAVNFSLALINTAIIFLIFAAALVFVAAWAAEHRFGLLHQVDWPTWVEWPIALVLFDLWMYGWHVANHKIPLLWRLHLVHHADAELDASTGLRFHTFEIVLSACARLAILPLLGMSVAQLLVYEAILQPIILFHHSNIAVPGGLDRGLRWLIVTPRMHWVHHSQIRAETDSNYASVLSVWDRIFRTFRLRTDPRKIDLGLPGYKQRDYRPLHRLWLLPFKRPDRGITAEAQRHREGAEDGKNKREGEERIGASPS